MPKADTETTPSSRAKSVPAPSSPPQSPHRVRVPITPTATSRSNPLDQPRSSISSSPTSGKERKSEKDSPAAVPASNQDAVKAGSGQQRAGVTRSTSTSSNSVSLSRAAAVEKVEPPAKEEPVIDMATFEQILELDEDDPERSFSKGIVDNYYEQVDTTFQEMEAALAAKDGAKLSSLGHFLKGSSAALGVTKVQYTCEEMQYLGQYKNPDTYKAVPKEEALERIAKLIPRVKVEYGDAKAWFEDFFSKPVGK